ncbi:MAG: precorrin-6A/cobalt-precorrin-6A reductase, partial [Pseudomonadota bacterium]
DPRISDGGDPRVEPEDDGARIGRDGTRPVVFLTTGPGSLPAFEGRGFDLICRRVDPAHARDGVIWVVGLPPFTAEQEIDTMRAHAVTDLVTKDSGGPRAKLDAAAALGVAVHVIERPPSPGGEETHDIDRALTFLREHAPDPRAR